MQRAVFDCSGLPKYHDNLLIVRLASSAALRTSAANAAAIHSQDYWAEDMETALKPLIKKSRGFETIESYARAGMIRSVRPLLAAPSVAHSSSPSAVVSALVQSTVGGEAQNRHKLARGVCFIELSPKASVDTLLEEISHDRTFLSASRVPARYL